MLLMSMSDRSAVSTARSFWMTWHSRLLLALATVAMLSLAYAPLKQFYFAWVGLVPWLVMVARAQSKKQSFFWSWLTGILFFSVNLWWIGYVTIPGAVALMFYMGLWFALVALVLRGAGLLPTRTDEPPKPQAAAWTVLSMFLIAAVWVATEW